MVLSSTYDFDSSVRLIVAMLKRLHCLSDVASLALRWNGRCVGVMDLVARVKLNTVG
jgi:hypothetical protein